MVTDSSVTGESREIGISSETPKVDESRRIEKDSRIREEEISKCHRRSNETTKVVRGNIL